MIITIDKELLIRSLFKYLLHGFLLILPCYTIFVFNKQGLTCRHFKIFNIHPFFRRVWSPLRIFIELVIKVFACLNSLFIDFHLYPYSFILSPLVHIGTFCDVIKCFVFAFGSEIIRNRCRRPSTHFELDVANC